MLLASAALGAVVLAGLLLGLTFFVMHRTRAVMLGAEAAERRHRAWSSERAGFLAARTAIADGVQAGAEAVQLGAGLAATGHHAIASIPFGILGAIPQTRDGSARVRDVHHGTAGAVYGTINAVSDGVGRAVRRKLLGVPDELAPPEKPPELEE
jgi:hypothetical protein